jgi:hypothetical protein
MASSATKAQITEFNALLIRATISAFIAIITAKLAMLTGLPAKLTQASRRPFTRRLAGFTITATTEAMEVQALASVAMVSLVQKRNAIMAMTMGLRAALLAMAIVPTALLIVRR